MNNTETVQKEIAEEIREKKIAEIQRHLKRMHSGAGHDSIVYLLSELSRIQQENERITKEWDECQQRFYMDNAARKHVRYEIQQLREELEQVKMELRVTKEFAEQLSRDNDHAEMNLQSLSDDLKQVKKERDETFNICIDCGHNWPTGNGTECPACETMGDGERE
jgi:DNA repair exonuclease SbcCD ATPase subunit